jgi:hypothetical protein
MDVPLGSAKSIAQARPRDHNDRIAIAGDDDPSCRLKERAPAD